VTTRGDITLWTVGGASKANNVEQIDQHGEGLKLLALVDPGSKGIVAVTLLVATHQISNGNTIRGKEHPA
jgi:hypothetical protein